jgi:hypothetical protein
LERLPNALQTTVPLVVFACLLPLSGLTAWAIPPTTAYLAWRLFWLFAPVVRSHREPDLLSPMGVEVRCEQIRVTFAQGHAFEAPYDAVRAQRTDRGMRVRVSGQELFIPNRVLETNAHLEAMIQREYESMTSVRTWKRVFVSWAKWTAMIAWFHVCLAFFKHRRPERVDAVSRSSKRRSAMLVHVLGDRRGRDLRLVSQVEQASARTPRRVDPPQQDFSNAGQVGQAFPGRPQSPCVRGQFDRLEVPRL